MRKLTKAVSLLTIVSVVELVLRFARTKFIAIFLGRVGTGFLAQLTLFFETLRLFTSLGTRRAVMKQIAEVKKEGINSPRYRELINSSFFTVLLLSGILVFLVTFLSPIISWMLFSDRSYYPYVVVVALIVPVASLSALVASILKGNLEFTLFSRCTIAGYLLVIIFIPFSLYFFRYWGALFIQLIFFLFPLMGYLWANTKNPFLVFSKSINFSAIKEQFLDGTNYIYSAFLSNLPKLVLASWITKKMGLAETGIYQLAMTVTAVYLLIPSQAVTGYMLPLVASETTHEKVTLAINDTARFLIFILTPVIVSLMAWPELFINVFYSAAFLPAAAVLIIQLIGAFFEIISEPFGSSLVAKGNLKPLYLVSTVHAALYTFLSFVLFNQWKLLGVAAAFSIASFVTLMMEYTMVKRYFDFQFSPKNKKLVAISSLWILLALWVGLVHEGLILRVGALLLMAPWFYLSSKNHERKFLWGKVKSIFITYEETNP
ncbi:MAG: oligosaccharide flippase family protein [Deltaproteobacteria bacterium]|nr:oligosaccharide flippase family protein [Deltaproteobacteria bacterium]